MVDRRLDEKNVLDTPDHEHKPERKRIYRAHRHPDDRRGKDKQTPEHQTHLAFSRGHRRQQEPAGQSANPHQRNQQRQLALPHVQNLLRHRRHDPLERATKEIGGECHNQQRRNDGAPGHKANTGVETGDRASRD